MIYLSKTAGCYICLDCPNHLVNQRFGYTIPCKEKLDCKKYVAYLTSHKESNRIESEIKALNYVPCNYKKKK